MPLFCFPAAQYKNSAHFVGPKSSFGFPGRRRGSQLPATIRFDKAFPKLLVNLDVSLYFMNMRTKLTKRGQVSVPSGVRKQLHIGPDTTLEWVVEGATARVIPVPKDPIKAFRGSGKKSMVRDLLKDRRQDRERENAS